MIPALSVAVTDPRLRGRTFRVYVLLTLTLDVGVARTIKQSHLARVLRLHRPDVNSAIRQLVDLGYLEPGPPDGSLRTYRLVNAVEPPPPTCAVVLHPRSA